MVVIRSRPCCNHSQQRRIVSGAQGFDLDKNRRSFAEELEHCGDHVDGANRRSPVESLRNRSEARQDERNPHRRVVDEEAVGGLVVIVQAFAVISRNHYKGVFSQAELLDFLDDARLRLPHADLIAIGEKRVEYRTWPVAGGAARRGAE